MITVNKAPAARSRGARWAGYLLGALAVAQLFFSAAMKVGKPGAYPSTSRSSAGAWGTSRRSLAWRSRARSCTWFGARRCWARFFSLDT